MTPAQRTFALTCLAAGLIIGAMVVLLVAFALVGYAVWFKLGIVP